MLRFQLGRVVIAPSLQAIDRERLRRCLARHAAGDWGDVSELDRKENERSLVDGARVWSVYSIDPQRDIDDDNKLWITTEADRSSTTILRPDDY